MHLLPCPACQAPIPVAPSQAGDHTNCPACEVEVDIPKLGQLRQLPLAESDVGAKVASTQRDAGGLSAGQAGFVFLGVIATASLLIAGFCTIRWSLIEVPMTTEEHIAKFREAYQELKPAELIREYEQMEEFGLDIASPYNYQNVALEKRNWGRNASIAGGVAALSILGAAVLAGGRRRNQPKKADT